MNTGTQSFLNFINGLIVFFMVLFLSPSIVFSATSGDYAPIAGTQWEFSFSLSGTEFKDTITFADEPHISNSNYVIRCTSSLNSVYYGTGIYYEPRFWVLVPFQNEGNIYYAYYNISITNGEAAGTLKYLDSNGIDIGVPAIDVAGTQLVDPSAGFTADKLTGDAPLTVSFTNQSEPLTASWAWNFGDGSTSTEKNPTHEYTIPGRYTVTLTSSLGSRSKKATLIRYIHVKDASNPQSQSFYRFERMWPSLQQPWYFSGVRHLTDDRDGNIYVVNSWKGRIEKLTSDGHFISSFGSFGNGNGQFRRPYGVVVDEDGYIYVTDEGYDMISQQYDLNACRVQKFDEKGRFIASWKSASDENDTLKIPTGISMDNDGHLMVADSKNKRIVKYSTDGNYLGSLTGYNDQTFGWPVDVKMNPSGTIYVVDQGDPTDVKPGDRKIHQFSAFSSDSYVKSMDGSGSGTVFNKPNAVGLDHAGNLYVADYSYGGNNRIVKIQTDGSESDLIDNGIGSNEGQFWGPYGVLVDRFDHLFVGTYMGGEVIKFDTDGQLINKWSSESTLHGYFYSPHALAVDPQGNIFVADSLNYRIQKLDPSGNVLKVWGSKGTGDGQFEGTLDSHQGPHALAMLKNGNILVADTFNNRLQIFDGNGDYVSQIKGIDRPSGLAVDASGNYFVSDWINHQIKKIDASGNQLASWGSNGNQEGQFKNPHGLAIDAEGYLYVADADNHRIQIFDGEGNFISAFGQEGQNDGQLNQPWDVIIDENGDVIVADTYNARLQKFTPYGVFIERLGESGTLPGLFTQPQNIDIGPDGSLFVLETTNNRLQKFKKVYTQNNSKAIVVAGGGPYEGNELWDATQMNANFAYRVLTYQGYAKSDIHYLSSDTGLDLDQNGVADDVDGDATNANLENAITQWAAGASDVVVYLTDHGGDKTFRMSGTQLLSANEFDAWLDTLQTKISGKLTIVYDACESGTFVEQLAPPQGYERRRIVITSTSAGQEAHFINGGSLSFSNYFWTHVFNGIDVRQSYILADSAITRYQDPLLNDNGNTTGDEAEDGLIAQNTYIGNGNQTQADAPGIGSIEAPTQINDTSSAQLAATGVTDDEGVSRVWAVIRPPNYTLGSSANPVQELPSIDLNPTVADPTRFENTYEGFNVEGTYQIAVYARDRQGNTSIPKLISVSVDTPLSRKVILVAGGSSSHNMWPAVEQNIKLAYEAVSFQGYPDKDIYLLSPAGIPGVTKPHVLNTLSNLNFAIKTWASSNTQDLVIYMVGPGADKSFGFNATEALKASDMDNWMDFLQNQEDTKVSRITVIYDACRSGSFLPVLVPTDGQNRILISSAAHDQAASFLSSGDISFSKFFWMQVLNGASARSAFKTAQESISFVNQNQIAQLDDNGNGLGNEEKKDGRIAQYFNIGFGIMLAGDNPLIGGVSTPLTLSGETTAGIWAEKVTSSGTISKVWAIISLPGAAGTYPDIPITDAPVVDFVLNTANNRWEGTYDNFTLKGTYTISVFAMDQSGSISVPMVTSVTQSQASGPDLHETDDTFENAGVIVSNDPAKQSHTFHDPGDQDWIKFYASQDKTYTIQAIPDSNIIDPVIKLYDMDGVSVIKEQDSGWEGETEKLIWTATATGIYFARVNNADPKVFGQGAQYTLNVFNPVGGQPGTLIGRITDTSGNGVPDVLLTSNIDPTGTLSYPNGYYIIILPSGSHNISIAVNGYEPVTRDQVSILSDGITYENFTMNRKDTIPPLVPGTIQSSPTKQVWTSDNTITVSWQAGSDADSGVAGYSYVWDTDSATTPDNTPDTVNLTITGPVLPDGQSHYFHIATVDNNGNQSDTIHLGPFFIDTAVPVATIAYSPANLTNQEVTATLSVNETVTITNNKGSAKKVFSENAEFMFTFSDVAGNTGSATAKVTWIDKTPPAAVLSPVPETIRVDKTILIHISGEGVVSYRYNINDEGYGNEIPIADSIRLSNLKAGIYAISVIGKDAVGNWQSPESPTTAQWDVLPVGQMGDVNGDANINLLDAILILKIHAGTGSTEFINKDADINKDEFIGMEETIYILQNQ